MKVTLEMEDGRTIELYGRTAHIILEVAEMGEEINEADQKWGSGEIKISWKTADLRVALSKYRVKSRGLAN